MDCTIDCNDSQYRENLYTNILVNLSTHNSADICCLTLAHAYGMGHNPRPLMTELMVTF